LICLENGAKPYYAQPGKECETNKWAFPAFGIPKKNTGEI